MSAYRTRQDGEPMKMRLNVEHHIACCDCGLVHRFEYRVRGKDLEVRAWRLNRETANRRRGGKFRGLRLPR